MASAKRITASVLATLALHPAFAQAASVAAQSPTPADPKPTATLILTLRDVAGFSGGHDLALDGDGNLFVLKARHNPDHPETRFWEQRFHVKLSPPELSTLVACVGTSGIARYRERPRNGVPDEARPIIKVALAGQSPLEVAKWDNDKDVSFDTLYKRLLELVDQASRTPAYRQQPYDYKNSFP
jgi:hypothetical protein